MGDLYGVVPLRVGRATATDVVDNEVEWVSPSDSEMRSSSLLNTTTRDGGP